MVVLGKVNQFLTCLSQEKAENYSFSAASHLYEIGWTESNDLVKKWKAIKDNFAKYQKKLKDANRSGAGAAKIKEYHLNKQLQFLKKVSQNATDSSLCVAEGDIENEITALPRYKSQPRKRKADDKDDIEEDLLAILKTPENRHLHFFKGILPSLQSLNENQTLIFQSRVLQILTDILQPSIHQNTHHGYNQEYQHQGYNQGYSTMRYDNTVQSGYHTSTPGSSITEQRTTSSSNQQRPINSPFLLDETSATSYVSQDEEELDSVVDWSRPRHLIVAGDLNAKSAVWGSLVTRPQGDTLEKWTVAHNLSVANRGSEATCVRTNGESIVDVTFVSQHLSRWVQGWEVLTGVETLSDHRYIRFRTLAPSSYPEISPSLLKLGPTWALRSLDKEQAELAITVQAWCPNPEPINTEDEAMWFRDALTCISDAAMQRSRPGRRRQSVFWWSVELAQLRAVCVTTRRLYTRARRRRPLCAEEESRTHCAFREAKQALRIAIAESKKRAWQELLETIERDPWGRPYQIVTNKLRPWAPPLTVTMEPDLLSTVVAKLFPERSTPDLHQGTRIEHVETIPEVSSSELETAIERMSTKKPRRGLMACTGESWPSPSPLVLACDISASSQNACEMATSPYRPIVLLDEAGKLFERIIAGRIYKHLESVGPNIHEAQFGFRKRRSTIDAIARLRAVCEEQLSRGGVALAISLDVANAFNTLPWENIEAGLKYHGLPEYIQKCIASYLTGRRVVYPSKHGLRERLIKCGVPQGSVLGPLLWNIGYDKVLRAELVAGVTTICYADDTLVVACGQDYKEARLRATAGVARVVSEIRKLGLTVALAKSEAICFHGHRRAPPQGESIIVGGVSILIGSTLKYLGLVLDPRWTFKAHFTTLAPNLTTTAGMLSRIMPNLGGPGGECRRLYANVVRAKALYGCPIWADKLNRYNKTILRQSQRVIAIRVARAYRTVSYDAACVIAGTTPWHLEADALSEVYWRRAEARHNSNDPALGAIKSWKISEENEAIRQWAEELATASAGFYTINAFRPHLDKWVRRRWGRLSYRLVQILSGHGCFGSYLHKVVGREEAPTCHHCDAGVVDDALHTLKDCLAWEVERRPLLGVLQGEDAILDNIVRVAVTNTDSDGMWEIFQRFCEAVMHKKEEAERAREDDPAAHPRRRRRPQRRRCTVQPRV
ncbi:unnamed protein product [Pieris macdunnoughi]|uniref:Reverse transcriptase n=1 Tax=Pieris macdunnoughi TaxID=345717 RepID=A0A821R3U4_9NEOP|nr:unnamed protein product [Pieris macdunnoughi]